MHERWLERDIAQRGGAKPVSIGPSAGDLFETEVLIRSRTVELVVRCVRHELWSADRVLAEISKHFI